ncbi:MAG: cysteine--tRNA ligase, partial [Gammaproteobacteria bacterium]|nr:cysteine--tRNA ligase [Gammaproteobacteria bacterium]
MEIRLYNTQTRKKDIFSPEDPKRVTMYVCGPTVYDLVHIGNGRPAVVFDVLYRVLHLFFEEVIYVRNITDIDDKINNAAILSKTPIEEITNKYIQAYRKDLKELDVLDPNIEPLATNHVPDI